MVGPLWLDILEGQAMKLAARIEPGPFSLARNPSGLGQDQPDWLEFSFFLIITSHLSFRLASSQLALSTTSHSFLHISFPLHFHLLHNLKYFGIKETGVNIFPLFSLYLLDSTWRWSLPLKTSNLLQSSFSGWRRSVVRWK